MANPFKNNFVKLPLFLLVTGVVCTAALSLVNSVTQKVIADNERKEALKAYSSAFEDLYEDGKIPEFDVKEMEVSESLKKLGIDAKVSVSEKGAETPVGIAYEGTVTGYAAPIKFVLSFCEDQYHKFQVISEAESNKTGINYLKENFHDYDVNKNYFEEPGYVSAVSGSCSITGQKLMPAINDCAEDYLASRG